MSEAQFEKVEKGLECCILRDPDDEPRCDVCLYEGKCTNRLKIDALALIRQQQERIKELEAAQTARVMTPEEVKAIPLKRDHVWVERLVKECYREVFGKTTLFCLQKLEHFGYEDDPDDGGPSEGVFWITPTKQFYKTRWDEYGKSFVCWTFKPTDEQREAVPWNG